MQTANAESLLEPVAFAQMICTQMKFAELLCCCLFREEMLDFMFKCHEVVEMIMESFARGLGLDEDFFKNVSGWKHLIGHLYQVESCDAL